MASLKIPLPRRERLGEGEFLSSHPAKSKIWLGTLELPTKSRISWGEKGRGKEFSERQRGHRLVFLSAMSGTAFNVLCYGVEKSPRCKDLFDTHSLQFDNIFMGDYPP